MKKIYSILACLFLTATLLFTQQATAQAPQSMSYQSVIRNSSNALVANTAVGIKISVLQGSSTGNEAYVETQTATTNANGLVSLQIGTGSASTGTFSEIDWANGPYFIKTEIDPTGGSNYSITGTQQMASVPYALYAAKSGGTVFETTADDPTAIHNTNPGNVGIGTDLPSEKLDVNGNVRIRGGNPAQGKVLTSDENGTASWQTPVAQSGTGGDTYWTLASGDIVTNLDGIMRSSLGIGYDMAPGFDFGFNTLVLRENNTRILFEDTSASGTFPSKDWRLTANDETNGGDNYFSIDNITDALVGLKVKDDGTLLVPTPNAKLGIGTDSPQLSIHAKFNNTPAIRLEQDVSGGYPAQVWDIIGNESNMAIRDFTNASLIPFKIKPNSPTNSLVINSLGVGIGTDLPSEKLDVNGNLKVRENAMIQGTSTANSFVKIGGTSSQFLMADGSVSEGILATIAAMQATITAMQATINAMQDQITALQN
jgi:hypothetical protein